MTDRKLRRRGRQRDRARGQAHEANAAIDGGPRIAGIRPVELRRASVCSSVTS